jgi:predicted dehydrogenase
VARAHDNRRVGLIGYGLAGAVFHAPLIEATEGLDLAAVVTSDPGRQARARAAHPAADVVSSAAELWALEPDLVVVAAPNRAHAPLGRAALERGVPVVIDKPLALSSAEAKGLAEAAGGRLTVFHNRRWDGDFLTARRLMEDGAVGRPMRFESRFERFRPAVEPGWRERPGAGEGGGQLLDLGTHLVDQARVLLGHPLRVYAEVDLRRPGAQVDDDVFIALEHPGGARSHLWMGAVAPLHGPRLALSGLGGGFACDGIDPQEHQLAQGLRPREPGYGERATGRFAGPGGERAVRIEPGAYHDFYAGVRAWLAGEAPAPVDARDAVAVLRILEAARESAARRAVVELPA